MEFQDDSKSKTPDCVHDRLVRLLKEFGVRLAECENDPNEINNLLRLLGMRAVVISRSCLNTYGDGNRLALKSFGYSLRAIRNLILGYIEELSIEMSEGFYRVMGDMSIILSWEE